MEFMEIFRKVHRIECTYQRFRFQGIRKMFVGTPDKNLHPEKFTYTTADTQERIHSVMDTETHAIIHTQKHVHSITDTEIHMIVDVKIHTHIRRNRYRKRATHIPIQSHTKRN